MTTSHDPMSLLRSIFRNVRKISLFSREMVVNSKERKSCRRQITLSGAAAFMLKSRDCLTVYIKGSGAHRQQTN